MMMKGTQRSLSLGLEDRISVALTIDTNFESQIAPEVHMNSDRCMRQEAEMEMIAG